ncbi:MAG TPA: hypothetical protein VHA82_21305 [Ramlibacter sp.]|uniref:hypothetical protein n=1 Tax=Ramlibacter sp. TaxID=1917967 RepID=UPI002B739193|nr:hypothetical protein [Ramlibacter sp.]HVZ46357.1 hypothetical protein [Ramlibacter sp.]
MKLIRSILVAGLATLGAIGAAQAAGHVYWSVGMAAAPGVTIGLGNAAPVVVAPAPVYVAPVYAPAPVYATAPVVYESVYWQPRRVYYPSSHVVYVRGGHRHWHH